MRLIFKTILLLFTLQAYCTEHMSNVTLKQFNELGKLEHSMHALDVNYEDEEIVIQEPKILQDSWELTANLAATTNEFKVVSFANNVQIINRNDPSLLIQTQALDYIVSDKLFTTKEYVTFKKNNVIMSGYGLHANLQQNQIKVLNDVHTVFEVN